MRILIAHNHYRQPGGEDAVVKSEFELLKMFGEDVRLYERNNDDWENASWRVKWQAARDTVWSRSSYDDFRRTLKDFRPDVVHFHNIFYALSPSVYQACRDEGVSVVQSLHNFRLMCANGLFFRQGRVCEDCLPHRRWQGILHRCYHNSVLVTGAVVRMMDVHWSRGTWLNQVDRFVTATDFTRQKYATAGIPAEKIAVKPNFVYPDPGYRREENGGALFVGRLSGEKGVGTLLDAWDNTMPLPLTVIGGGPEEEHLKSEAARRGLKNVDFPGYVSPEEYDRRMRRAAVLIVPSVCYENFPRIVAEAFAYGVPVLASRLGSLAEIIEDNQTGRFFEPGQPRDLAGQVRWFADHPGETHHMGRRARDVFEKTYSAEENYRRLKDIYQSVIPAKRSDGLAQRLSAA